MRALMNPVNSRSTPVDQVVAAVVATGASMADQPNFFFPPRCHALEPCAVRNVSGGGVQFLDLCGGARQNPHRRSWDVEAK